MRWILVLVALAAAVIAAATIADYPGGVDVTWQGWEIETSVDVLLAAVAGLALALWLIFSLITRLVRVPARVRRNPPERPHPAREIALTPRLGAPAPRDPPSAPPHSGPGGGAL